MNLLLDRCPSRWWTPAAFLTALCLSGGPPLWAAPVEPCDATNPTEWACVCEELRDHQAYGVDPMIEACQDAESFVGCERCEAACPSAWRAWVDCRLQGTTQDACHAQRVAAMACGACVDGRILDDGANQILWVMAQAPCKQGTGTGTFEDPFCSIGAALDVAVAAQTSPTARGTKVAVCPGLYREEYTPGLLPSSAPGAPPVVLESVVQHEAIMTGTDDWASGWQLDADHGQKSFENLLPFSEQFDTSSGWSSTHPMVSVTDAGPLGPPVTAVEFQPGPSGTVFLSLADSWGQGRFVYSIYVRPYGTSNFVVDLVSDVPGRRPTYAVTLPPTDCTVGPHEGADGFGYEAVANGWYRMWVAGDLLGKEADAAMAAHANLAQVRLWFQAEATRPAEHAGVAVWGAQLEQYPLGRFATEPSRYTPTHGAPATGYEPTFPVFQRTGWTKDWGLAAWHGAWSCPAAEPVMRRSEQVFLAGQPLRPVLNKDELVPGTFFLDDGITYEDHKQRWPVGGVCPAPGLFANIAAVTGGSCSDVNPCTLYVAPDTEQPVWSSRSQSFGFSALDVSTRQKVLRVDNTRNWTVRGLTLHGAAGEGIQGGAAVFLAARDFTFTDNKVVHNSGTGFGVTGLIGHHEQNNDPSHTVKGEREYAAGAYVARNESSDNGILGASLFNHLDIVVEDEVYRRNNWRGRMAHFNSSFVGGCKFGWIDKGLFQGLTLEDNHGNGLWYDYYSVEVDIVDLVSTGNHGAGVFLENAPNLIPSGYGGFSAFPNLPVTHTFRFKNAHVAGNHSGIVSSDTPLVSVRDSFVGENHDPAGNGAQVAWTWVHRDEADTPEGLPNGLSGWTLAGNTYATCADDAFYAYGDTKWTAWTAEEAQYNFMRTLVSDENIFLADPTTLNETGFVGCPASLPGCPYPGPVPTPGPLTGPFSLNDWRTYTVNHFGIEHDRCSSPAPSGGC